MKKNKIGAIFLISVLALASIGISYAGFTDTIYVYGTVKTATVELDLEAYSGTDVYKVWGPDIQPDDEVRIFRGYSFERPNPADPAEIRTYFGLPETTNVELISSAWSHDYTGDGDYDIGMTFDNLFPCIDFTADFILHYEGSIPAKVNVTEWILYTDWLQELYVAGGVTVEAYRCNVPNPDQALGPDNYPTLTQEVVDLGTQLHYCDYVIVMLTLHLPQNNYWQDKSGEFAGKIGVIQWNEHLDGGCGETDFTKTYTVDADFDEGILTNVNYDIVQDQLQLNEGENVVLPFIWVPNQGEGTVSKVDTETGKELGRYRVNPSAGCSPSRTTVDLNGNCWVGCRDAGTVVKIGLSEAGAYDDRNGDGIMQTSQDLDNDGDIQGAEILPWGEDECVLFEVVLIPGKKGTYIPGDYTLGYSSVPGPRGLAIDASNNLWAGCLGTQEYHYINGATGAIVNEYSCASYGHSPYGAVIDGNGILWSSGNGGANILKLDPSTSPPTMTKISMTWWVYGLGLDYSNHLFASGWSDSKLHRLDTTTAAIQWQKAGPYQGRGVAVTSDNNVWVASTNDDKIYRYDNDGNLLTPAGIPCGNGPTGVAVDAAGKVWACNLYDDTIRRIDPTTNTVDLTKSILGSGGHYSYSDMTGIISQTITTKIGTWEVVYDAGAPAIFDMITWNDFVPTDTSIKVEVASSSDGVTWSSWEIATNGGALSVPNGQYLKIKVTFQITSGDVSPILYDLTIHGHTT